MLALGPLLLLTLTATAQSTPPAAPTSRHVIHRHVRHPRAKAKEPVVVAPVAPPPPVPPAQQPPHPAKIDFRPDTLRIDADNSSLVEILNEVSRKTGLAIDGLNHDERVYGQYGPGSISSTLSKLLDGAGYNYIIVGGSAGQPPTKLLLTMAGSVVASPPAPMAATFSAPIAAPAPENPSEPTHPKTPQEIFNELRGMRQHPPPQ